MGKPQSKKGSTAKNKVFHRIQKTKHFSRQHDQIYEDLQPHNAHKFENLPQDEDLPGLGQFYCVTCAKHFVNKVSLDNHKKSKDHKKMVKTLKEKPYDLKEAEFLNKY